MEQRKLGANGQEIGAIGFGAMSFSDMYGPTNEAESHAVLNAWLLSRGPHVIPIPGTRSVDHLRECILGAALTLTAEDLERIEAVLPVGWAHGDRYSDAQWAGPERYC